jgi:hypothetical protein
MYQAVNEFEVANGQGVPNCTWTSWKNSNCLPPSEVTDYYVPDCTDPVDLFASAQNFAACIILPNVTRDFEDSTLPYPGFAAGLAFSDDSTVAQNVVTLVSECLPHWCNDSAICQKKNIGQCSRASITSNSTMLFEPVYDCLEAICSDRREDALPASPDIAGIGVIISYYVQFTITVLGSLTLWYCTYRVRANGNNTQEATSARANSQSLLSIVLERLVDLQKAQCYFAFPLQIASFIFLSDPETANYVNVAALTNAARASFIPVAFNFLTLCIYDEVEKYLISLTMIVEFMGLVLDLICYYRISRAIGPEACGLHAAWTLCSEAWKTEGLDYAHGVNAVGFAVWILNVLFLVFPSLLLCRNTPRGAGFSVLQVAVTGLLGVHVYTITITQRHTTERSDWSFGQVIAVTIWLPVIAEFLYKILKHLLNLKGK